MNTKYVGKHSEMSLVKSRPRRGTELYLPEQFNRTSRGSSSFFLFFIFFRFFHRGGIAARISSLVGGAAVIFRQPLDGFRNAFVGPVKSSDGNQLKCGY